MLKRTQAIVTAIVSLIIVAVLISTAFFFANQKTPFGTPPLHIIVDGNFTVSGANPSEIRVYIWDNAAFTNWQNGQISQSPLERTISFYDSGLTTNGTIEATPYPGGTYFLIYKNNSTEPQNITSEATFWYIPK
jgi:hypothetical protein